MLMRQIESGLAEHAHIELFRTCRAIYTMSIQAVQRYGVLALQDELATRCKSFLRVGCIRKDTYVVCAERAV
jgi:hypothetical protein